VAVIITLNGAATNTAFLIGGGSEGILRLKTNGSSTVNVTLRGTGPLAGAMTFTPASLSVNGTEVSASVKVSAVSAAIADAVIEAVVGGAVVATFAFTSVTKPEMQFEGRFQCRLATDPDGFDHKWGAMSSFGMYAVQGPNAAAPFEPPLDRIVRFQNAVALRSLCPVIGVKVLRIRGELAGGTVVSFEAGDEILGTAVSLGPKCVFDAQDGAFAEPGFEPISNFELAVGTAFSGKSEPGLPRPPGTPPPSKAPYADGFFRMDNVSTLRPPDFGFPEATWTARSTALTAQKLADLNAQVAVTPAEVAIRARRILEHTNNLPGIRFAARMVERYTGVIDQNITVVPGNSSILKSFAGGTAFRFHGEFFDFDSDCQSGTVWGTIGKI